VKKHIFSYILVFFVGLGATQAAAWAQDTPGLDGVWRAEVFPADCQTGAILSNTFFLGLNMFGHDGSFTNDAAFQTSTPRRGVGVGSWQHTQGHAYTLSFQFFRYNADGSFLALRKVTAALVLNGDQYATFDKFQDYDINNNPLPATGCNVERAARVQ
jgi:hypothetical protein